MTSKTPKPWARLYATARWERRSKLNLRMFPLCAECKRQGRTQEANLSHHVDAYRESYSELEFWYGKLESLCFSCHAIHHGYNLPRAFETDIGLDGFPTDPAHPFWIESRKQESRDG
jgi:5-methylcytosine-specific restriction enzyme A